MNAAQRAAAAIGAVVLALPLLATFEGLAKVGYRDIGGVPTYCYGSTRGAVVGRHYTDDECTRSLAQDALSHGLEIAPCLPEALPVETRAAFTSAAYNLGAPVFCGSSMSKRALDGDLAGACRALSLYVFAGGKDCRKPESGCAGLVRRRAAERELCERGLK